MPAKPRSSDARLPVRVVEVPTPLGPARLHLEEPPPPGGAGGILVLGHGAGGGVGAPDLLAAVAAATAGGWCAVRVEQPWRVAGRRVAPAPPRLDEGWLAVLPHIRGSLDVDGPLVVGGRSAGARVACRTAVATGAAAVLCLAFPLHPPGRPGVSRAGELAGAGRPAVVVQGTRDAFGTAADVAALDLAHVEVLEADGDHGLAPRTAAGRAAVAAVVSRAVASALALAASGPGGAKEWGRPGSC